MPKSLLRLIFFVIAVAFIPGPALAQSATLTLSTNRTQVNVNDMVVVALMLNATESATSLKTSLTYDPALLFVAAIDTTGSTFPYWWENTTSGKALRAESTSRHQLHPLASGEPATLWHG